MLDKRLLILYIEHIIIECKFNKFKFNEIQNKKNKERIRKFNGGNYYEHIG